MVAAFRPASHGRHRPDAAVVDGHGAEGCAVMELAKLAEAGVGDHDPPPNNSPCPSATTFGFTFDFVMGFLTPNTCNARSFSQMAYG